MDTQQIQTLDQKYVLHTYSKLPFVLDHGQGAYLYDTDGKAYLDFVSGIAVNALGYGDPDVVKAIQDQAAKLMHVSNLYCTQPQAELAQILVENSFADKVYFCNSGAESVEAAIKFARKAAKASGNPAKTGFVAFSGAFHGRTMGALALTPRPHYQEPFEPLMPGATIAEWNDLASAQAAVNENTCAVIVEPLQGEGGVYPADVAFIQGLRELCDQNGALLIFDEVQCGLGRTGDLWGHTMYGVAPDIMTLAKPLGGGLPMGATLVNEKVAAVVEPGDHASTFAANPVVAAAAVATLKKLTQPEFVAHVREIGSYLEEGLMDLAAKHETIQSVRGRGAIWGVECSAPVSGVIAKATELGLLTLNAGPNVLRLLPPLIVTRTDVDLALSILDKAFEQA